MLVQLIWDRQVLQIVSAESWGPISIHRRAWHDARWREQERKAWEWEKCVAVHVYTFIWVISCYVSVCVVVYLYQCVYACLFICDAVCVRVCVWALRTSVVFPSYLWYNRPQSAALTSKHTLSILCAFVHGGICVSCCLLTLCVLVNSVTVSCSPLLASCIMIGCPICLITLLSVFLSLQSFQLNQKIRTGTVWLSSSCQEPKLPCRPPRPPVSLKTPRHTEHWFTSVETGLHVNVGIHRPWHRAASGLQIFSKWCLSTFCCLFDTFQYFVMNHESLFFYFWFLSVTRRALLE